MNQVPAFLADCENSGLIPFIQGPPGTGKSESSLAYAKEREKIDIRASYFGPQDLGGYPHLVLNEAQEKTMQFSRPAFWPKTEDPVVIWEEMNLAKPATLNCLLESLNDKRIGRHVWPKGTFQICLGNGAEDRCSVERLSSATIDRLCLATVRYHVPSWLAWAQVNDIDPVIISFIEYRPELLSTFNPDTWDGVSNFSTPRAWTKTSKVYRNSTDRTIRQALLNGLLGRGVMTEFLGFVNTREGLPCLKTVLKNPDTSEVPTEPSVIYATAAGLAEIVKPSTMAAFLTYMKRFRSELTVFAVRTAVLKNKSLCNTPAFTEYVSNNPHINPAAA